MTIDIDALKQDKRPQSSIVVHALLDRLEAAEAEAFEEARLNGMGSEREAALMAKLETAEKDIAIKEEVIDSLATVIKRLDAQCDAAEKERNTLRTTVRHESDCVEAAKAEIKALRAKIEQMERQKPVGKFAQHPSNGLWEQDGYGDNPEASPLYALPGARPAPSIPDDVMRDAKRYRFLRAAKNIPISTEAARDPIVYDAAIDAAMLAAAQEANQ